MKVARAASVDVVLGVLCSAALASIVTEARLPLIWWFLLPAATWSVYSLDHLLDARRTVGPGDCVFIPSGAPHGLENHMDSLLRYFSAAAPSFNTAGLDTLWPLGSERDGGG